jgi:predicted ATP-grasp superfamily ATP-dependent carboligase
MKVLVLDAGNSSSYHVMRSLGRSGHEVHLLAGAYCHWRRSKYCGAALDWPWDRDEDETESAFIAHLISLLEEGRYGLLLSCGDGSTEHIYAHFERVSGLVDCATPGPRVSSVVFSKSAASSLAHRVGVPVPRTVDPRTFGSLAAAGDQLGYPLVVKGQKGSGSSNVRFVSRAEDLETSYREIQDLEQHLDGVPALQEYLGGQGFLVHLLFWRGEPYAVCSHRKDREYPIGGGVTSAATTVDVPELKESALEIARALEWHGLVKMDFVFDPLTREYKFIEIDPRVSASIDITRAAGVDQALMLCDLVAGKAVRPALNCRRGVRYRWLFPRDLMVGAAYPRVLLSILPDLFSRNTWFDLGPGDWRPFYLQLGRFVQEKKYLDKGIARSRRRVEELRAAYTARTSGAMREDGARPA